MEYECPVRKAITYGTKTAEDGKFLLSIDDALGKDLLSVKQKSTNLKGDALAVWIRSQVWGSPTRTAFFIEACLFKLIFAGDHFVDLLQDAISYGASTSQAAKVIFFAGYNVIDAVKPKKFKQYLELLKMIDSASLLNGNAVMFSCAPGNIQLAPEDLCDVLVSFNTSITASIAPLIADIASNAHLHTCFQCLILYFIRGHCHAGIEANLETMWKGILCDQITTFVKWETGCPFQIFTEMIKGTSVKFLVHLYKTNLLDELIRKAKESRTSQARATLRHLAKQWPSLLQNECEQRGYAHHECPITLFPCRNPVMASDGRIYERDAIMQVFIGDKFPVRSPVTCQIISYDLIDVYV